MTLNKQDISRGDAVPQDRDESVALMEPLRLATDFHFREPLNDLANLADRLIVRIMI
ncbi:MAG: hypothetical protein JXR80_10565 [Deltaproteobacteria bacterium]|nr:hypothetical protein [Deltaproteobacteria bacterium]